MPTAIAIVPSMLPIEGGLGSLVATAPPLPHDAVLATRVVPAAIATTPAALTALAAFVSLASFTAFVVDVAIAARPGPEWFRSAP